MITIYTSKNWNFNVDIDKFYKTYLNTSNRVEKINIQLKNSPKGNVTVQNKIDELNSSLLWSSKKVQVTHDEFDDCYGEVKYAFWDFYLNFKMKKFKSSFSIFLLKKIKIHTDKKLFSTSNTIVIEKIDEESFKKRLLNWIEWSSNFNTKIKENKLEKFKTELIIWLLAWISLFIILNYYNLWDPVSNIITKIINFIS